MAAIQGLRGSGEFSTDFRPKNYRELFTLMEPNGNAPLNALLAMGSRGLSGRFWELSKSLLQLLGSVWQLPGCL